MTLAELHNKFIDNCTEAIYQDLADVLGCNIESVKKLEIGFYPGKQVWVFPERDADGRIIGLSARTRAGNKFMLKDSQRGLLYVCTPTKEITYTPGAHNWIRCTPDRPCPICGRIKYCLVSADNPDDPQAVLCTKQQEGSDPAYHSDDGQSFLHIRKAGGRLRGRTLPSSLHPLLIVEGASDVLAADTLGLIAIGKPNSKGGHKYLEARIAGRPVIVMGENDGGEGERGMRNTHALLIRRSKAGMLLPPPEFKDLRQWLVQGGLTIEDFLAYAKKHTEWSDDRERIFEEDDPLLIAQRWIAQCYTHDHTPTLRYHMHRWVQWDGHKYVPVLPEMVKGALYNWLQTCRVMTQSGGKIEPKEYIATRTKVSNITEALSSICPVEGNAPMWLAGNDADIQDITVFKNGILNTRTFEMQPCTPDLFSYNGMPYNYDPDADQRWWISLVENIFNGDQECIRLLQQWFGYNMVADTTYEKLMIFIGPPRSGKGTITEALKTILGQHQVGSTDLDALSGPFGYEVLLGKLAVTVGDLKTCRETSVVGALEKLLNVTGGDGVSVNIKGKPAISHVYLPCRFTISMNLLPSLYDHANAILPRLNLLQFPNSYIGREDRTLKAQINKSGPAIAAWALRGLMDLRKEKKFVEPGHNSTILHEFKRLNSPMIAFVEDCCEIGEGKFEKESAFYELYKRWCKAHFITAVRADLMVQRMRVTYPNLKCGWKQILDSKIFGWQGACLTANAKREFI